MCGVVVFEDFLLMCVEYVGINNLLVIVMEVIEW